MSKSRKSRNFSTARSRRARNKRSIWVTGALLLTLLIGAYIWQQVSYRPPVVQAVTGSEAGAELLPLADPVKPLVGGHNMDLIPDQLPQPWNIPEGTSAPRVDLPVTEFNFGVIPPDPEVAYIFVIQNTGTADLHLSNLVTSCGCTTAELSASVIPPGRRAELLVTFDPDYHVTNGEVIRLVWLVSDDPAQPWIELAIRANVNMS